MKNDIDTNTTVNTTIVNTTVNTTIVVSTLNQYRNLTDVESLNENSDNMEFRAKITNTKQIIYDPTSDVSLMDKLKKLIDNKGIGYNTSTNTYYEMKPIIFIPHVCININGKIYSSREQITYEDVLDIREYKKPPLEELDLTYENYDGKGFKYYYNIHTDKVTKKPYHLDVIDGVLISENPSEDPVNNINLSYKLQDIKKVVDELKSCLL